MHSINILDGFGNRVGTVGGVSVSGPARGVAKLVYDPRGSVLSASGQASFEVPMTIRRNLALGPGASVEVVDTALGVVGTYLVTEKSESVANSGHTATFVCPDLLEELRWQIVAGFAADSGHTNSSPADPIPTHNAETVANCAQRIVAQAAETAWAASVGIAGSMTETFAADGTSVQETVAAFAKKRYAYYRLGAGRTVEISQFAAGRAAGTFTDAIAPSLVTVNSSPTAGVQVGWLLTVGGETVTVLGLNASQIEATFAQSHAAGSAWSAQSAPSGIRLVRASQQPAAMNRPAIRPIIDLKVRTDGRGVVNCLVPTGGGTGALQVTLADYYNPVGETPVAGRNWYITGPISDPSYSAAVPVYRRRRSDGLGVDGWQYFIVDTASIAAYREHWATLGTQIAPIGTTKADLQAAAADLYLTAYANLRWHAQPTVILDVVTTGSSGDNRALGGNTVRVEYKESVDGTDALNISGDYFVLSASRAVNDTTGQTTDTWKLSSTGLDTQTNAGLVTGMLQAIDALGAQAPPTLVSRDAWIERLVDRNHPVDFPVDVDLSILNILEYTFTVSLLPAISPINGATVADHHHSLALPGHALDATVGQVNETGSNRGNFGNQFTHGHGSGQYANQFGHGHGGNTSGSSGLSGGTAGGGLTGSSGGGGLSGSTGGGSSSGTADNQTPRVKYPTYRGVEPSPPTGGGEILSKAIFYITSLGGSDSGQDTHGHGVSGSASGQGLSSGAAGGQGLSSGAASGHNFARGASAGTQGIANEDGFKPSVDNGGTGWVPQTNFPGYSNDLSYVQTVQTSGVQDVNTVSPTYAYYADPSGKASSVAVLVDGAPAGGPFAGDFVIDLGPYLDPRSAHTVRFTSATFGRLVIRAKSRARGTTARIGTYG